MYDNSEFARAMRQEKGKPDGVSPFIKLAMLAVAATTAVVAGVVMVKRHNQAKSNM